jgi:hypothetical protein
MQWFGHTMGGEETNEIWAAVEYKPIGKRPWGKPKKRLIDEVQHDLEKLEVTD